MKIYRIFIALSIFLCLLFSTPSYSDASRKEVYSRTVEIRAVWMDRKSIPKTEQGIRELVRSYSASGINLLFPEVIYNGYSAYPSVYLQQQDLWNGLDMLGIIIDEAHKCKMEVHPWVWVFRTGNASDHGGILKKHPDWAAVDKNDNALSANRGYWLCPSMPQVRFFLTAALRELVRRYPVDGIHLDYIRFEVESPQPYCYNESCRQQFKAAYGIDPSDIEPFTKPVLDWQLWRENLINSFVSDVSTELKKVRPGIQISAAVGSIPSDSRMSLLQDWGHWADNKWVDFLCPMDYTSNSSYFEKVIDAAYARVGDHVLLAPGLGFFLTPDVAPVLQQIDLTRTKALGGFSLFASAYLDSTKLQALSGGPFRKRADLPTRVPVEKVKELISSARTQSNEQVAPDDLSASNSDLATATSLLNYWLYRAKDVGYVPPTPPPVFIPEKVEPMPQAIVPITDSAPKIDGNLSDSVWETASVVHIRHTTLGAKTSESTDVLMAHDKDCLYLAFRCFENSPGKIKASITEHDGAVFSDDSVEVFLCTAGTTYYHFAVNGLGTEFESKVYDTSWNGEWQSASARETGAWTVEIAIPFKSLGVAGISPDTKWGANFCRNRITDSKSEPTSWSVTYGSYHTPSRFGTLLFDRNH